MKGNKGFTLIELLAVIVILGVLLAIAIPSVSKYINTAKKSAFIINVKEYVDAAKKEVNLIDSDYQLPVNHYDATIISFDRLQTAMENGGKKSPYGGEWVLESSSITIVNDGTAERPHYTYYVLAYDDKGYILGIMDDGVVYPVPISYDNLSNDKVYHLDLKNVPDLSNYDYVLDDGGSGKDLRLTFAYTSFHDGPMPVCSECDK